MQKIIYFLLLTSSVLNAQMDSIFVDDKYLEDQLYVNISYNKLLNLAEEITQTGFSYGIGLGFIRDFPVNKRRNIALGAGVGYGVQVSYFNAREDELDPDESAAETRSNRVALHTIEMPLEFRFRTSTPEKYKFWRIYPGFKMAYTFVANSNLKQREDFDVEDVIKINKFIYGATISAGYNKWNLYVYYGLNDLFTNTENNSYPININDLRLGLIFYFL